MKLKFLQYIKAAACTYEYINLFILHITHTYFKVDGWQVVNMSHSKYQIVYKTFTRLKIL